MNRYQNLLFFSLSTILATTLFTVATKPMDEFPSNQRSKRQKTDITPPSSNSRTTIRTIPTIIDVLPLSDEEIIKSLNNFTVPKAGLHQRLQEQRNQLFAQVNGHALLYLLNTEIGFYIQLYLSTTTKLVFTPSIEENHQHHAQWHLFEQLPNLAPHLQQLTIEGRIELYERVTSKQLLILLTRLPELRVLRLPFNNLDNYDICTIVTHRKNLEVLDISGSPVGKHGIAQISVLKKLRKLIILNTDTEESYPHGYEYLKFLKNLKKLDVSSNEVGYDCTTKPASNIGALTGLEKLIMNDAGIQSDPKTHDPLVLRALLTENLRQSLRVLHLKENHLIDSDVIFILENAPNLIKLDIRGQTNAATSVSDRQPFTFSQETKDRLEAWKQKKPTTRNYLID